jgi:hypothetical protein
MGAIEHTTGLSLPAYALIYSSSENNYEEKKKTKKE